VNHEDNEGTHLIHYAVHSRSFKLIKLLVDAKVNLKAKDQYGLTALVYALKNKNKNIVDLIKNAGGEY
jgi:ankyrin repeat protein